MKVLILIVAVALLLSCSVRLPEGSTLVERIDTHWTVFSLRGQLFLKYDDLVGYTMTLTKIDEWEKGE